MTAVINPEQFVVAAAEFAVPRFWEAVNRLVARLGHDGHQTHVQGQVEPTNRYGLHCLDRDRVIAVWDVDREESGGPGGAGPPG
jgi:hypothetical protein